MTEVSYDFLEMMARRGLYSSARRLRFYTSWLFRNADFTGRRVLDVGGGSGIMTLYAAASGASTAVCLEPQGSTINALAAELGVAHAEQLA